MAEPPDTSNLVRPLTTERRGLFAKAFSTREGDLRTFLDSIGRPLPATNDPAAFAKLELVTRLQGTPNSLALEDLAVKLDDSTFTGRVAVEDFAKQG